VAGGTPGGRYWAEFDDQAPVTREGQLIFFAQFLHVGGRWERFLEKSPLAYRGSGLVLGQRKVEDKSNEITAVPELLRTLELSGCIVTLDAMGCQRRIAREIIEADADYVLALKGNQGTAHAEIKSYLDEAIAAGDKDLATYEQVEKGHGRLESRRYWQSARMDWFADRDQWEGLRSVGVVEAVRETGGKTTTERRYYLSSWRQKPLPTPSAATGEWKTSCTGSWTSSSAKTRARHTPATPRKTSPCCAVGI
jgi:predicted transposase YbfD/YdcC